MKTLTLTLAAFVLVGLNARAEDAKASKLVGKWEAVKGELPAGSTVVFSKDGKIMVSVKQDPGDPSAADRGGVCGHRPDQTGGEGGVAGVKGQERHHRPEEVLDGLGMGLLSAAGAGRLPPGVALGGPRCFEFGPDAADGGSRCPAPPREDPAALLLLDSPVLSGGLGREGGAGTSPTGCSEARPASS